MLERVLLPKKHAIAILLKDHDKVKGLFSRFERAKTTAEKERIIDQAVTELKIHASIEEDIFYPAVREHVGADLMNEADEEHHVARVLIAELDHNGGGDHRHAKFTVLAESVRHHIKEEEGEMLPKAKELKLDFLALGEKMMQRQDALRRRGVPEDAEHSMVAAANGRADTPAAAARRTKPPARKSRRRAAARRPSKTRRARARMR